MDLAGLAIIVGAVFGWLGGTLNGQAKGEARGARDVREAVNVAFGIVSAEDYQRIATAPEKDRCKIFIETASAKTQFFDENLRARISEWIV